MREKINNISGSRWNNLCTCYS